MCILIKLKLLFHKIIGSLYVAFRRAFCTMVFHFTKYSTPTSYVRLIQEHVKRLELTKWHYEGCGETERHCHVEDYENPGILHTIFEVMLASLLIFNKHI